MSSPTATIDARPSRARQAAGLLRALVSRHPRLFAIAVAGSAVFAVFTVLSSAAVEWVTDHVIVPRFEDGQVAEGAVATGVALVMGIALVRAVGVVVRRSWAGKAQWRTAESLTEDVVDRLSRQPAPWMRRHPTGQLIARAGVDVEAATAVMAPMPFSFGVVVMVVVACIWLLATDVVMGLVALVVFPALAALNIVYQGRVGEHFDEAQHQLGELSAAVHESFEGVMVVKAFGAERRETERLASIASRLREARIRAVRLRSSFESLLDAIPTVVNIGLVVLGAARVEAGAMTVGAVTSVVYLFTIMVFPLRIIGYGLSELPYSIAGHERVRALIDDPVEPDPAASLQPAPPGEGVRLTGVRTSHDDSRDVLEGVDLAVPAGQTVAVVGATGAGKTTLLHVVEGLIPPTEGDVATHAGTRCLVFQEPFLLAASVRENLTLELDVGDDALWRALDLAGAGDFVRSLPQRLDTVVGERGVGLSGGQRQRIALARALVRAPALLLLDDTTSALDPETEVRVLANLRAELSDTTVLAVASRPSTIALADQVVFLRDGRVAAQGTHAELLGREPAYRDLMASFEHDRDASGDPAGAVVVGGGS